MAAIIVFSRSPDALSADTIIRTFRLSSAAPRLSKPAAVFIRPRRMPVKVDRRILRRLHHVHRHDERRMRAIVENARRRELRAPCSCADGSPSFPAGTTRRPRSACRVHRRARPGDHRRGEVAARRRAGQRKGWRSDLRKRRRLRMKAALGDDVMGQICHARQGPGTPGSRVIKCFTGRRSHDQTGQQHDRRFTRIECEWARIQQPHPRPLRHLLPSDLASTDTTPGSRFASFWRNGTPSVIHFGAGAPFR